MIDQVVSAGAHLESEPLFEIEILEQGSVDVGIIRPMERVAADIAPGCFAPGGDKLAGRKTCCIHRTGRAGRGKSGNGGRS